MKLLNLLSAAVIPLLIFLTISCNKEEDKPYTSFAGSPGKNGYCSVIGSDGALYITGSRWPDLLVLKTDLHGKLIWEKTYDLFGPSVASQGWTIEETFDHGYLISAYDSKDTYYSGLLKINAAGDSIWSCILQDSGRVSIKAVAEVEDQNIIVLHDEVTNNSLDLHMVTISKFSPNGILLESKSYPEFYTSEVWTQGWKATQDGKLMISVSRYNQAASIWSINSNLDIISQESFEYGKEIAYFAESTGSYICADQIYDHSTHLFINKAMPENDPEWEQDIPMPCVGWVYHNWIAPTPEGYMVIGTLWDEGKSTYYLHNAYCMGLDTEGNQTWLWYDDVTIYGIPYNFHSLSNEEYLIVGHELGDEDKIVLWRLKKGNVIN